MIVKNNYLIDIAEARKLSSAQGIPLFPVILDILKGGVATTVFLIVTYGLDHLAEYLGFQKQGSLDFMYYLSFTPLALYMLSSSAIFFVEGIKSVKRKWQE